MTNELDAMERERDGWRRVAVIHGAEIQLDHDYMASHYKPLQEENLKLVEMVGKLSDELRVLKALNPLVALASNTVEKVMSANADRHEPDEWKRQGVEYHLAHAREHNLTALRVLRAGMVGKGSFAAMTEAQFVEEMDNAATRIHMAKSVYLQNQAVRE